MALKTGDLFIDLDMDVRRFNKGMASAGKDLDVLDRKATAFAKSGSQLGIALIASGSVALASALLPATGALVALPAVAGVAAAGLVSLSLAVDGVGEAMGAAVSGDIDAFNAAIEELSPAAQSTARAVGGAFFNLQETAQEAFFGPVSHGADQFASQLGGPVRTGIASVAGELGQLTAYAMALVNESESVRGVTALFEGTAQAIDNAERGFGTWLKGLGDLIGVFIPSIDDAGDAVGDGLARWGQWMSDIAASGQALSWFHTAREVMGTLWSIASNLTSALYGIFTAADGSGLLSTIESLTAEFAAWVHSAEGQQQIVAIMSVLGDIAGHLMTILPLIASTFAGIVAAIDALPGPVQNAITFLGALAVAMQFLAGLAAVKAVLVMVKWAMTFASIIAGATAAAGRVMFAAGQFALAGLRMAAMATTTAARVVAGWVLMGAQALLQGARMDAGWVLAMGPVGWVIAAVVGLAALIFANWDSIVNFTKAAFEKVSSWLQVPFQWVKQNWPLLLAILTGPIGLAVLAIAKHKDSILNFFRDLPSNIKSKLSSLSSFLLSPFKSAFNAVSNLWNASLGSIRWEVPSWVPGLGGNSLGFPQMPYLAKGGTITRSGLAMVGERGPEVLHLPKGASVNPLDRLGGSGQQQVNNQIDVTVRLGDREIRDIVGVEISERNRAVRRRALAGATG
ncbi:hypothetical protein [Glycomyces sp. YM15]|uniref:hypothetical protein n=1 Tax=Glycomyces sp. YM15 TaxID=2800446 RepID=UPI0019631C98|nr:hypothetical protein [Glycomyces sp. YM15]